LPAVGVYIGGCWVLVEILDRLVERYFLSPYLTDLVFWGLYSLLPAVILIAWTHGRPGKDRATRAEKVGVPVNILLTVGLLLTAFGGKDLGATADLIMVDNELGQREEHYVPKDSYRRRLAVFFFDNASGDPQLDWLQYGVTELLVQDLQQNPFMAVASPWDNRGYGLYRQMKQAGYADATGLPLSLQREIAARHNRPWFVEGSVERNAGTFSVTARLWSTESLEMVSEEKIGGKELLPLVDRLSEALREVLKVPAGTSGVADLPLVETYGTSEEALRLYVEARNVLLFENDYESSNALYDRALAVDPGFVLAWLYKGINQFEQGNAPDAQVSLAAAQKLDYRLPEQDQTALKVFKYRISGQQDKLEKFLRLQTRVRNDAVSYRNLAGFQMLTGNLEEAKEHYHTVMRMDSSDVQSLEHLSMLERATGNVDAALDHARRYVEARPDDVGGHLDLGDLLLGAGDLEAAREVYERAQLLDDPPVDATLRLALLAIRQGEWPQAKALIEDARSQSISAQHRVAVYNAEQVLEIRRGRLTRAMQLIEEQQAFSRQVMAPYEQVFNSTIPLVQLNIQLDRVEAAEELLESAQQSIQPPLSEFLAFSEAMLRARTHEFETAEAAMRAGVRAVELFKADYLAFQIPLSAAEIARERGDYSAAARYYQESIDGVNRSIMATALEREFSVLYSACARMHIKSGDLDAARSMLDYAFKRDMAEPRLWLGRAELYRASGSLEMAMAAVDYALAIWAHADPDYIVYREARALRDELLAASG
jgi:tetratricopeptide (TPR) repeat protein